MIQDIAPDRLDNAFAARVPRGGDAVAYFDEDGRLYVRLREGRIGFPEGPDAACDGVVYLFSVNERAFFLAPQAAKITLPGYEYKSVRELRDQGQGKELFAAFTAWHLWRWYMDNRFCGRCGNPTRLHDIERALQCSRCGHVMYPRINPAVIVGVIKGDCLLITRYRTGYGHNALVAGFTEIGETAEQTVQREVMEETGIRVKNIRYYKSQPWGIAQDLLMGFFCEADGDGKIRMDENELKYAEWVRRDEIVLQPNDLSLTNEMMKRFKLGDCPA
jgi:NAD+ diphosphatase